MDFDFRANNGITEDHDLLGLGYEFGFRSQLNAAFDQQ